MALFNWSAQYETGIFMVDTQHKKLVDAINTLHDSMKDGKGKEVAEKTLNFLVDYTIQHFSAEEDLMKKKAYPDFVNHKANHDKFVAEVKEIKAKYLAGKILPMQVSSILSDWLKNHILGTDKKYVPFLKN
ncbi:MAG: bacteriohemerythrin [Ignavibacteriales bacterium]|jgi:hemerythrin|nr:bacteriohemerythrin [Ignavibacteriales bacterium]